MRLRRVPLFAVFVLVLSLLPIRAFAADKPTVKFIGDDTGDGGTYVVFDVVSNVVTNNFEAAAWVVGVDPSTLSELEKAYLSDSRFCPGFSAVAASLSSTGEPVDVGLLPYYTVGIGVFWQGYVSNTDFNLAREELYNVRHGNYPSGGGSSGGGGAFGGYTLYKSAASVSYYPEASTKPNVCYYSYSGTRYYLYPDLLSGGLPSGASAAPATLTLSVSDSDKAIIDGYIDNGYDLIFFTNFSSNGSYSSMLVVAKPEAYELTTSSRGWPVIHFKSDYATGSVKTRGGSSYMYGVTVSSSDTVGAGSLSGSYALSNCSGLKNSDWGVFNGYINNSAFGSGGGPSGPETQWPNPEPPEPPRNPDVPEPDPPSPPDPWEPDPYEPGPDVTEPSNTSPNDYTPWLRAILQELIIIHLDMVAGMSEIDSTLARVGASIVNQSITNLTNLENYLYGLFHWLAEQFDFTFYSSSDYDDSGVIYWLKMIWAKMGGSSIPDIGLDPDDFWDWLNQLLLSVLGGLASWLAGILGTATSALGALTGKFPFSLPWDLATIIMLFVHEPVTPVFDIPFGYVGGVEYVHVDLSIWNDAMAGVRAIELCSFGVVLAKRTPDMLQVVDAVMSVRR